MKSRNWDKLYNKYVEDYYKKQNQGYPMTDLLDKESYKAVYKATENDRLEMVKNGERKTLGAINRDIVNDSIDSITSKQAQKISHAAKELGIKVGNWVNLRKDKALQEEIFDELKNKRDQLRKLGYTTRQLNTMIGRDFFGSP